MAQGQNRFGWCPILNRIKGHCQPPSCATFQMMLNAPTTRLHRVAACQRHRWQSPAMKSGLTTQGRPPANDNSGGICPDPSLCEDQRCTSRMSLAHTRGAKGARIDWFWACPPIMSPFATGRIRFADASSADAGNAQLALHVHQPGHEARVYVLDAGSRRNCDPTAQCHPTPA